jgi:tetrahydromethanopterin S-methyltransferase subunit B
MMGGRFEMRPVALFAGLLAGFLIIPSLAQSPPPEGTPTRIRGTVEKLDAQILSVKSRDGQNLTITLAPNVTISAVVRKTIADVKTGDFIASTGLKGSDGKLHAVELRILPESLRGALAESQGPWDSIPDSVMTNATAGMITETPAGHVVHVTFKGQESEFIVDKDTGIYGYVSGDVSLLKPGAAIFTVALKKTDGSLTAARITAEKDGVKPPL